MSEDFPSRSLDKIVVRLPEGMRERLKEAAEQNKRSVNAEVVARLEESLNFKSFDELAGMAHEDLVLHMLTRLEEIDQMQKNAHKALREAITKLPVKSRSSASSRLQDVEVTPSKSRLHDANVDEPSSEKVPDTLNVKRQVQIDVPGYEKDQEEARSSARKLGGGVGAKRPAKEKK
nr:Arc family DNA-binding protein [Microvirga zambiensis]